MTASGPSAADASELRNAQTFQELGEITRTLHAALAELGLTQSLVGIAQEIPDARERLTHVGRMTELAATRVLDLVDSAQPACRALAQGGQAMAEKIEAARQDQMPSADSAALMAQAQAFSTEAAQFALAQNAVLGEIMVTQDFQDLSGQVIKKVLAIIGNTEQQLVHLLMHCAPEHLAQTPDSAALVGPQVPDKALPQSEVDAMLAQMGF